MSSPGDWRGGLGRINRGHFQKRLLCDISIAADMTKALVILLLSPLLALSRASEESPGRGSYPGQPAPLPLVSPDSPSVSPAPPVPYLSFYYHQPAAPVRENTTYQIQYGYYTVPHVVQMVASLQNQNPTPGYVHTQVAYHHETASSQQPAPQPPAAVAPEVGHKSPTEAPESQTYYAAPTSPKYPEFPPFEPFPPIFTPLYQPTPIFHPHFPVYSPVEPQIPQVVFIETLPVRPTTVVSQPTVPLGIVGGTQGSEKPTVVEAPSSEIDSNPNVTEAPLIVTSDTYPSSVPVEEVPTREPVAVEQAVPPAIQPQQPVPEVPIYPEIPVSSGVSEANIVTVPVVVSPSVPENSPTISTSNQDSSQIVPVAPVQAISIPTREPVAVEQAVPPAIQPQQPLPEVPIYPEIPVSSGVSEVNIVTVPVVVAPSVAENSPTISTSNQDSSQIVPVAPVQAISIPTREPVAVEQAVPPAIQPQQPVPEVPIYPEIPVSSGVSEVNIVTVPVVIAPSVPENSPTISTSNQDSSQIIPVAPVQVISVPTREPAAVDQAVPPAIQPHQPLSEVPIYPGIPVSSGVSEVNIAIVPVVVPPSVPENSPTISTSNQDSSQIVPVAPVQVVSVASQEVPVVSEKKVVVPASPEPSQVVIATSGPGQTVIVVSEKEQKVPVVVEPGKVIVSTSLPSQDPVTVVENNQNSPVISESSHIVPVSSSVQSDSYPSKPAIPTSDVPSFPAVPVIEGNESLIVVDSYPPTNA